MDLLLHGRKAGKSRKDANSGQDRPHKAWEGQSFLPFLLYGRPTLRRLFQPGMYQRLWIACAGHGSLAYIRARMPTAWEGRG